jgi:gliding motility-associated-like protein
MSQDGGLGAVTTKNVLLNDEGSERLVAARHADGISVWVILNEKNSNIFESWLITCQGIAASPVVSVAGDPMNQFIFSNNGMMKVSSDGRMLVQTHRANPGPGSSNYAQLFEFNNFTGQLSNPKKIGIPSAQLVGCEFSPDSRFLYLVAPFSNEIYQVECTLPTEAEIVASRVRMPAPSQSFFGIQLAPDGKIYLSESSSMLSVISKPNQKAPGCNFQSSVLDLQPGRAVLGLPNFINDLSVNPANGFDFTVTDPCNATVQFNGYASMAGTLSWQWDFGDGNTSNLQNPVHSYASGLQHYTVRLVISSSTGCATIERTKVVYPGGMTVIPQFQFVAKCDSGYVRFVNESVVEPDPSAVTYEWNFGDGHTSTDINPIHSYAAGGAFNVSLSIHTSTPCLDETVTVPINLDVLDVHAPADMTVEANQPVQLFVTGGGSEFAWSPNIGLSDSTLSNPIAIPPKSMWYKVTVRNDAGCVDTDSVYIKVNPMPGIYVPTGFTPNKDGKNDVIRPILTKEYTLQEFSIYNRWGERLFTTSVKDLGWNGMHKGMMQETGAYVWVLRATDIRNGEKHFLRGTFVLIH